MKRFANLLFAVTVVAPLVQFSVPPKAPILGKAEVMSSTQIRWHFKNTDPNAVAFELWNVLSRSMLLRVDGKKISYIDETNVVPADPDMACGRYVVAVNAAGERSFGQVQTYPCVRTPPVAPPPAEIKAVDQKVIHIGVSSGANDPATGVGIYEAERGNWVSPDSMFTAKPYYIQPGMWGADQGVLLIGLRPNSSYTFYTQAQSVTGELSPFTKAVAIRMPAEIPDPGAPTLDRIGELSGLRKQTLLQTFATKQKVPVISGLVRANAVTIDLDDRPYAAKVSGSGEVKSFSYVPDKLAPGLHYMRIGAQLSGSVAWTPTIEFRVK